MNSGGIDAIEFDVIVKNWICTIMKNASKRYSHLFVKYIRADLLYTLNTKGTTFQQDRLLQPLFNYTNTR